MTENARKMRRGVYWITTILGMTLTVVCVLFIYWLVRPYNYISADQPHTLKDEYQPGGPAFIQYDEFCVNTSTAIRVQRYTINVDTGRKLFFLPYEFPQEKTPVACYDDLLVEVPLPAEMNPGTYELSVSISYKPNPIRTETVTFTTNPFEVTLKEGS